MSKALRKDLNSSARSSASRKASEDMLIIQCPSCQARFALAGSALDGIDSPRFHCSRCDCLFSPGDTAESDLDFVMSDEEEAQEEVQEEELAQQEAGEDEEHHDKWTTGWRNKKSEHSKALEIPRFVDQRRASSSAPQEASPKFDDASQISFNFGSDRQAAGSLAFSFRDQTPAIDRDRDMLSYREPTPVRTELPPELVPPRPASPWRATLLLAAPFLVFLTILAGVSFYLGSDPSSAAGLSSKYLPNAPQIAPAGLMIRDVKFRKLALENGELVRVISGTIKNHTDRTFQEIMVEGLAFDESGKKLVSRTINAGSSLAKTRIKSFSTEMIEELQARPPARRFMLEPGGQQEFALALFEQSLSKAKYYSARIYSVR